MKAMTRIISMATPKVIVSSYSAQVLQQIFRYPCLAKDLCWLSPSSCLNFNLWLSSPFHGLLA